MQRTCEFAGNRNKLHLYFNLHKKYFAGNEHRALHKLGKHSSTEL
jgi:hypothetical protein